MVQLDHDSEVQAWHLTLSEAAVATTVHVSEEVTTDVDEAGDLVGVEFLLAPATIEPSVREALFARFPVVRVALSDVHSAIA
jgi:uncharacterized protein YuzE